MNWFKKYTLRLIVLVFILGSQTGWAQDKDKASKAKHSINFAQRAQESLAEGDFAQAEAYYRRAIEANPDNAIANYNFGNLYYKKKLKGQSSHRYQDAFHSSKEKELLHRIFHNQGNVLMSQEKYAKAVSAYKNALRNDPTDDQTRYNLAIAKRKLKKKRKKQKKNKKKKKDKKKKNKKKQKKKKKQDNKNKKNKKNKKKGGNKKDKKKDKKSKNKQKKKQKKKGKSKKEKSKKRSKANPKKVKGKISKQRAKNILRALQRQEKQTRKKVKKKKAEGRQKDRKKAW